MKPAPQRKTFMSIFVRSAIRSLLVSKSLSIPADVLKGSKEDLMPTNKSFRAERFALMCLAIAMNKGGAQSAARVFLSSFVIDKGCLLRGER